MKTVSPREYDHAKAMVGHIENEDIRAQLQATLENFFQAETVEDGLYIVTGWGGQGFVVVVKNGFVYHYGEEPNGDGAPLSDYEFISKVELV